MAQAQKTKPNKGSSWKALQILLKAIKTLLETGWRCFLSQGSSLHRHPVYHTGVHYANTVSLHCLTSDGVMAECSDVAAEYWENRNVVGAWIILDYPGLSWIMLATSSGSL